MVVIKLLLMIPCSTQRSVPFTGTEELPTVADGNKYKDLMPDYGERHRT